MLFWYNSAMERKAYPLPLSAQIPAEAIRYSDVRSRVEIASEAPPVVNFRESNLKVLYVDLGMGAKSVARAIGLSKSRTYKLLHSNNIPVRESLLDPVGYERRVNGIKAIYSDPERRSQLAARVHTREAGAKRGAIVISRYRDDEQFRTRQLGFLEKAWAARSESAKRRVIERADKITEQLRLQKEADAQYAQRLHDNPAYLTLSPQQKRVIDLLYRTDGGPILTPVQVAEAMRVSRQAVHIYETNALVKLGILKKFGKRSSQKIGG